MKLNVDLHYKDKYILMKRCVVEKTILLSGPVFDDFSRNLLKDWDFIKENKEHMFVGTDGSYHCLLVTGEGREDGLIIESEGYDYARYAAHVPHIHSIMAMERYPALAELNRKLTGMADYIVEQAMAFSPDDGRAVVGMDALEEMSGIDIARNSTVFSTLTGMLNDRPEVQDWELDANAFIITPAHAMTEPEQEMTMGM